MIQRLASLALALACVLAPIAAHAQTMPTQRTILTSTSATACTSIQPLPTHLVSVTNTGAAMAVYIQFYDEGATPTCAAADNIFGNGTTIALGAGQVITFNFPMYNGIAYKLSGALTANLVVTYF